MSVGVIEVSSPKTMEVFNSFPRVIYRGFYRAPDFPARGDRLFARVAAQAFLAVQNGRAAGRIAACLHHALPQRDTGFFGYFESLDDPAVARALLEAAARWLSAAGARRMIGPVDLTPHERVGLLVAGFGGYHHPGMPFNPPHYPGLLERSGLAKETDLFAYHCDLRRLKPERLLRAAARAGRIQGLRLRQIDFSDPDGEGEFFSRIHNGSMEEVWGFVPLSPEEGSAIWRRLRGFYDPGLILFAEVRGEPAGLCLVLYPVKRGILLSGPAARFNARLAVLAVLPRYRFKGLEAALLLECARRARSRGISAVELSLVAETNTMMNRIIQGLESAVRSRVYRIYQSNGFSY
ncbi:MAG: GNAT family N-acetyltransferase [Peptococcaceae bacterium]|nr:GNAT family N-acetyltransferase [Peptococcaceae bacterium]